MDSVSHLHIERINDLLSLSPGRFESWSACVRESHGSFFQSPVWVMAWWRYFNTEAHAYVLMARDRNDRIVAVFPGMIVTRRWCGARMRVLTMIGDPQNEIDDIPCYPGYAEEACAVMRQALYADRHRWDAMYFPQTASHSVLWQVITRVQDSPSPLSSFSVMRPQIRKQSGTANTAPSLSKNDINRRFNMLKRHAVPTIELKHNPDAADRRMRQFAELFSRRSRETGYSSPFATQAQRSLFTELARTAHGCWHCHIASLAVDDTPIACIYWIESPHARTFYANTFDPAYQQYSPASILLRELIRDFYASPQEIFDLGRGDMRYKLRFSNYQEMNHEMLSTAHHPIRRSLTKLAWTCKRYLKRSPAATSAFQGMKRWVLAQ